MRSIIAFLLILAVGIGIAYYIITSKKETLPVFHPSEINPRLVDESLRDKDRNHTVADFALTNQLGATITQKDLEGKYYVADFFFTRCPTICPVMSGNMYKVQEALKDLEDFRILSHSVTPEADSVSVLLEYAERYDANHERWWFLTGPKADIYALARKSYFAVLDEGDGGMQDFIHTENFVLVDKDRRLRGFYDGTRQSEIDRLIADVRILSREYE
jgi:protein SCO1/2